MKIFPKRMTDSDVDQKDVITTLGIRISKEQNGTLPKVVEFVYEPKYENGPRQVKWLSLVNGREASFLLKEDDFPNLYKKIKDF